MKIKVGDIRMCNQSQMRYKVVDYSKDYGEFYLIYTDGEEYWTHPNQMKNDELVKHMNTPLWKKLEGDDDD